MRKNKEQKEAGKTRKHKKLLFISVTLALGAIVIIAVNNDLISFGSDATSNINTKVEIIKTEDIDLKEVSVNDITNTHELWLVNGSHAIRIEVLESSLSSAYQRVAISRSDLKMNSSALKKMEEMFTDANKNSIKDMVITSGYRSRQKQAELYEQADDKTYVQNSGCSEHETGLAADIQLEKGEMNNLGKTKQGKWLERNAWAYGFILRYPEDKKSITGISYEAWHFRYVGVPHAAFMKQKDLCLEEYMQYLKTYKQYAIKIGDEKYQVYRTTEKNKKISVPRNLKYTISDDNCGGYIISVILK